MLPSVENDRAAKSQRIRDLNDALRTTFSGGRIVMTAGVDALPDDVWAEVLRIVSSYSSFTTNNDANSEHDFGNFEVGGKKLFWKIDYYDPTLTAGSEDPGDPSKTTRVLTIMLAEEY